MKEYNEIRRDDAQILSKSQLRTEDDRAKGLAIISQRKIWERALNVRIRVQKLLASANKMPQVRNSRAIRIDFLFLLFLPFGFLLTSKVISGPRVLCD